MTTPRRPTDTRPAWLVNWESLSRDQRLARLSDLKRANAAVPRQEFRLSRQRMMVKNALGVMVPESRDSMTYGMDRSPVNWPDDGGAKRVELYDRVPNPPRLVRVVGWINCLSYRKHRWLSPDVRRVRICTYCKELAVQAEGLN